MTVPTSSPRVVGINTKWASAFTKVPGTKQAVNELEQVYLEVLLCALHNAKRVSTSGETQATASKTVYAIVWKL